MINIHNHRCQDDGDHHHPRCHDDDNHPHCHHDHEMRFASPQVSHSSLCAALTRVGGMAACSSDRHLLSSAQSDTTGIKRSSHQKYRQRCQK